MSGYQSFVPRVGVIKAEAVAAEQKRILEVLRCPEAKGRHGLVRTKLEEEDAEAKRQAESAHRQEEQFRATSFFGPDSEARAAAALTRLVC